MKRNGSKYGGAMEIGRLGASAVESLRIGLGLYEEIRFNLD